MLWYVHHHGSGHWRRAIATARVLRRPVAFASSSAPPAGLPAHASYHRLEPDAPAADADPTAGGRLHWAPRHHAGLLARHATLLGLVRSLRPALAVVDVSVEVCLLLRVSGVPVLAVRLPGSRDDAPHRLAHELAEEVVTPVPASWGVPGTGLGLVSALEPRPSGPLDPHGQVLVVLGAGGSRLTAAACEALAGTGPVLVAGVPPPEAEMGRSGVQWLGPVPDLWPLLAGASAVVGGAGLGTVADVATARRPFLAVPDVRPFGEQVATGAALERYERAVVLSQVPDTSAQWREALRAAAERGPLQADVGGAERFAAVIAERTAG